MERVLKGAIWATVILGAVGCVRSSPDADKALGRPTNTDAPPATISVEDRGTLKGHDKPVKSVALTVDGKLLASASEDQTIKLWDVDTGKIRTTLKGHTGAVVSLAFSKDGQTLASASYDNTVRVWDIGKGEERTKFGVRAIQVYCVAMTADGKTLAVGSGHLIGNKSLGNVDLIDVTTRMERRLESRNESVRSVVFSPDGMALASGGDDHQVTLWDVATGKETRVLKGHSSDVVSLAFTPDGKTLASGSWDHTAKLWDPATGTERLTVKGPKAPVQSLSFSADGKLLAGGCYDGTIKIWDTTTGQSQIDLTVFDIVNSVAIGAEDKLLIAGGGTKAMTGEVKLWALVPTKKEGR